MHANVRVLDRVPGRAASAAMQIDMFSRTGAFGEITDPGEPAHLQTPLLALLGRTD